MFNCVKRMQLARQIIESKIGNFIDYKIMSQQVRKSITLTRNKIAKQPSISKTVEKYMKQRMSETGQEDQNIQTNSNMSKTGLSRDSSKKNLSNKELFYTTANDDGFGVNR